MRLPESRIKAAILHPQQEVRLTATSYFSDAYSDDPTVMPLVIEAVEKYGRDSAFRILRDAERLAQTKATVEWLSNELRRDYDIKDIRQDNYRFAVAVALCHAQVDLLNPDMLNLPSLPLELKPILTERLQMVSWGWDRAWKALESLGQNTKRRGEFQQHDIRYAQRIVEALARYPDENGDLTLCLLRREYPLGDDDLMEWLDPVIIDLAGEMRLQAAIPILMERLLDDDLNAMDSACTALFKIGGDAVVEAIADEWWDGDSEWRDTAADLLEHIHTDLCVEKCIEYLDDEEEPEVQVSLAHALLAQFPSEAIRSVRHLVVGDEDELVPDQRDLRYRLVAVATIMEETFPEYDEWYAEALENNWGCGEYTRPRLADAFRDESVGPPYSGNGKG